MCVFLCEVRSPIVYILREQCSGKTSIPHDDPLSYYRQNQAKSQNFKKPIHLIITIALIKKSKGTLLLYFIWIFC